MGSSNTLIQSMVPDHLRGRVMSVYSMAFIGMGPFGSVWAGYMAEHFGAPITLTAGAVACLVVAVVFAARLPAFRAVARELIVAQQATGGAPVQEITATGAEAMMETTGD
jgi:MFS family permease